MKQIWCTSGTVVLLCVLSVVSTHAQYLCLSGDFEQQSKALLEYIRQPDDVLNQVPRDIERVLHPHWPGCKVTRYGSTVIGVALKSSDVDCYVDIPEDTRDQQALVSDTLDILKNNPHLFHQFQVLSTGPVLVLTCVHVPTDIFVDFTFIQPQVINGSRLASYFLHLDQRALDLATIIKYWASVHDIANGKTTLPSYSMVLMSIFYLQQKNILPTVAALQQNVKPYEENYWNMAYKPIEYHTNNNETLYDLLGGFFKYYSDFDFENTVISPYVGYPVKRKDLEDVDKLNNFPIYKRNIENGFVEPFLFAYINIQDSLRHSNNVGWRSSNRWLADRLIDHVKSAARMFDELSREEFLTAVLVPEKRIEAGVLKTFWSGGIGDPVYCRQQISSN